MKRTYAQSRATKVFRKVKARQTASPVTSNLFGKRITAISDALDRIREGNCRLLKAAGFYDVYEYSTGPR